MTGPRVADAGKDYSNLPETQSSQARCPFDAATQNSNTCPASPQAQAFDPFLGEYQISPAEALRWSRDKEPIFYSPKLDYWVVSRYEDIKAIFRDNILFSPSIALEKITPVSQDAVEVLKRYDYAMDRTLVNEDDPAHLERRRALMHSFEPEELSKSEPMVRQLTREYVNRIIDKGKADLVNEMLWEVPLIVALNFLGVPKEDLDTLREFSVAHTVNTWGRPSPEEQLNVAEQVGRFWKYSGKVLDKMRQNPSASGWMQYGIRRQREMPDVVTDSYLHSMMMAGIVAAHETTAHASANMFRLLLDQRAVWQDICNNTSLIPNAVEECLRHSGSVVAWRRLATSDTRVGGIDVPKNAKLLIVTASANHDERHFENPDELDIYRDNTADHLTFGYGGHQCMGKNLARMEMRIFLEEVTTRIPHMELLPNQTFTYLPNISFRGPEHLWVQWDSARNPERNDVAILGRQTRFAIGAPAKQDLARPVRICEINREADGILSLTVEDAEGRKLPRWTPGSHLDVEIGNFIRQYSLCGTPLDRYRLKVSVLNDRQGRGGSSFIHEQAKPGMLIGIRGPKNRFRLDESAACYLLIAAGIGITPIIAMADQLKSLGKNYEIHYAGRSLAKMAFVPRLQNEHQACLHLYSSQDSQRLDLKSCLAKVEPGWLVYACGPERLLNSLSELTQNWPNNVLHVEHFSASGVQLDPDNEIGFDVELKDSRAIVHVSPDKTVLQALREAGVDVQSDCEEGLCGTCEVKVIEGEIDHRDKVLTQSEREENRRMMVCCSRARTGKIVLAV